MIFSQHGFAMKLFIIKEGNKEEDCFVNDVIVHIGLKFWVSKKETA